MATPHPASAALVTDLQQIFGSRLRSIVAYGPSLDGDTRAPLTCLVLADAVTVADLERCAASLPRWRRAQVATPLLLPIDEFERSLDVFPIEYGEILRAHEIVFGGNPFAGLTIAGPDLRRACETQVKSHLLHLREAFVETGGKPSAIAGLIAASAPGFAVLLRNVAHLGAVHATSPMDAAYAGARAADLPEGIVADVLALVQQPAVPRADAARLFPDYLAAVERLAHVVDTWRAS